MIQLRLHLRLLRPPLGLLLLEAICCLLPLLLALLREEVALLIYRVLERLDQLVLALRIAPQKGDDLKGVGLSLVLLHLERIVLAAQVLAAQLVLVERATPRIELYSLYIVTDHAHSSSSSAARNATIEGQLRWGDKRPPFLVGPRRPTTRNARPGQQVDRSRLSGSAASPGHASDPAIRSTTTVLVPKSVM